MSAILIKSFVGQAERYVKNELTNKREIYYSEKTKNIGQWTGKGAEALGLKGDIAFEDFARISRGIDPTTGERFRRMTFGRTREINGEIKQVKEIAGWDMVISAPKSVSIAGLIGQDERVRTAHEEAVTDALERAEQQAQANLGGGKREQTGNLIVARFKHDSARPSKDGFVAPQLHDHCFIMNATLRADGTLKPLESLELHKAQSYIRSVYYTGLADRLQKLGYAIEIDRETGAPEITGISKEYRLACSPRRTAILELAKEAGKNFRQLGLVNRREKIFDKDLIHKQHKGIDGLFDYQAQRVVETAGKTPPPGKPDLAKEAVTFALTKLSERESVFNPRVVLLEANKRGIGQTSVAAIEAELETRKKDGQVKTVSLSDGREAVFLSSDEKIENELPKHIKAVQPKQTLQDEILTTKLSENSRAVVNTEFLKLSDEQQSAVKEILTAKTGVVTLEGRAGVGKTTTLSFVNKMAKTAEYEVLGLAPTTGAAQELDNAQITSATLQKLLASQDAPRDHKRFFIVDESSFVSSRQMDKFFREAVKTGDRVLLVGDTRQHEGVEAGKPFARIQREELTTGAKIETIRRQTKETDRETVKNLSEGKIIEAVEAMRQRGQVVEVKDRAERHNAIVEAYTREPEKSLVVAPRNADRQEINSKIHEALKDAGKVGKEEAEIKILRPRSELSGTEREFAAAYREGDVISYTRGSAENNIVAKSLAKVVKTDREQNLLTVEIKDGRDGAEAREITYNPKRLRGVSVWTEEKIKVSTGDRLQLRAPFEEKQTKIANGTMLEVSKITPESLTLTTDKGKTVMLDTERPHAIDYGYAVTSHSSQGKTIDRVLVHAETSESKQILNERMAYVAVSRARNEALIFTDDAQKLAGKMARQIEKTEITQAKAETVEHAPERAEKIVLDAKPEFEKAERGEIKQPVISPTVEQLPIPTIEIQPAQEKTIAADVKPELAPVEREEIKSPVFLSAAEKSAKPEITIETKPEKSIVVDTKPEVEKVESSEIKQPVISPAVENLPTAEIKIAPMPEKTTISDAQPELAKAEQKETEQLRQIAAEKLPTPAIEIPAQQKSISLDAKPEVAKTEREEIEIQPARKETVVFDAKPEVERREVKQPVILPKTPILPTAEIKAQPQQKTVPTGDEPKVSQETLIKEVLQISRNSLTKQGIDPDPQAWKRFANTVISDSPNQKPNENQERILESLQKNLPEAERVSFAVKTSLEATHAILKLAPENRRDEIVKGTLARYEKEVAAERGDVVIKPEVKAERSDAVKPEIKVIEPEIKKTVKTTSFEKAVVEEVKPALKIRDFEAIGREKLISELVTAARDEARTRTGEDLSYKQEKRLTKIYRAVGDKKPLDKQVDDLNALQERFSEPIPQPKTYLEATVLKLDNITDAEKSAALRQQIEGLNQLIRNDEIKARESAAYSDHRRSEAYFIQDLYKPNLDQKTYFSLTAEAQERGLAPYNAGQSQIKDAISQMEIANGLQHQIQKSLDEQGIKLEPLAQRIINTTIDSWTKEQPTAAEYKNVQDINQMRGGGIMPENRLEAKAYVFANSDERERDKISSSLASAASEKADELKIKQAQELKLEKEMTQENPYDYTEGQTQGRSR
jgi:conjugative relaxase-like TrwC/TraI family protein